MSFRYVTPLETLWQLVTDREQSVSFWMSVSAVLVEGFAVAAKVFLK